MQQRRLATATCAWPGAVLPTHKSLLQSVIRREPREPGLSLDGLHLLADVEGELDNAHQVFAAAFAASLLLARAAKRLRCSLRLGRSRRLVLRDHVLPKRLHVVHQLLGGHATNC